ncbi:MAG: DUF2125 domain-containing protein [Pseudomonadota bacterium]
MRIRPRYLIVAILCLIAFVGGQWFFFKSRFEAALPQMEARAAAMGLEIAYDARTIQGFPFRLEAHYTAVRIARTDPLLSFAVDAERAVVIRQLLGGDLSLVYMPAPKFAAAFASPLPRRRSGEVTLAFQAEAIHTSLRADGQDIARISTVIEQPKGASTLLAIGDFSARQLQFHLGWPIEGRSAPSGQMATRLKTNIQVTDLALLGNDTGPLPSTLAQAEMGLDIDIPTYAPLSPQGLSLWQQESGRARVRKLSASWGDVSIASAKGAITLDDQLRPKGNILLGVTGLAGLTYALDKTDILAPGLEEPALLTLRLLRAGKKAEDEVPLTFDIADAVLRLGPAPLVALGPVAILPSDPR